MKYILAFFMMVNLTFAQDFVFDKEKGRAIPSYVGQIKLLKGKVYKKSQTGMSEVEIGERFRESDTLITEDKSFAKVLIVDDTIISVGPKSEVKFDEFDFKDKFDRKLTFSLIRGQLTGDIKNKAKPGDIKFRTKYTTMGIRGTYILMNHQTQKQRSIAEYAVLHGKTEVHDEKNQQFELGQGDRITLIHDESSQKSVHVPGKLSDEEMDKLSGQNIDEENEFKPFLPFINIPEEKFVSSEGNGNKEVSKKREAKKVSWQENLEKLNQKLKENQKKK